MGGGNRFHPYALPDTRDGGVPDSGRFGHLLPTRLEIVVGSILDFQDKGVGPVLKIRSHIK